MVHHEPKPGVRKRTSKKKQRVYPLASKKHINAALKRQEDKQLPDPTIYFNVYEMDWVM